MEIVVKAKAVLAVEKESNKRLSDILDGISSGNGLGLQEAVIMMKHATNKTEAECLDLIDSNDGILTELIKAYSGWVIKAYTIAESGN
jgi:hypothetical protein